MNEKELIKYLDKHIILTNIVAFVVGVIIIAATLFSCATLSHAGNQGMRLTLPDGSTVPLDGLGTEEIRKMAEMAEKVVRAKTRETTSTVATDMMDNPEKLDVWRKLITGTIKDICTDLNVTVNDFIKTPVGTITAALIIYKVAGKELLERIFRVVFITSFWSIMMGILFYLRKKYFSVITIYEKKKEIYDEVAKKFTTRFTVPKLVTSYPWYSKNINGHSESRTVFAVILVITGLVTTITSVVVALT